MREIKFRAWDAFRSKMRNDFTMVASFEEDGSIVEYPDVTIMQYTGLKDKKGVEIYEGDIYKTFDGIVAQIIFKNGCFCGSMTGEGKPLAWSEERWDMFNEEIEVIGNIHQNPELL